jgi:hypothetical protein
MQHFSEAEEALLARSGQALVLVAAAVAVLVLAVAEAAARVAWPSTWSG